MTPSKWSRISRETLLENPYYRIVHDRYVQPDGEVGDYQYIDIQGSAMVIPVLESGEMILVRQFRYLMQRECLEFPAGGIREGSAPIDTAKEELMEEAGFAARRWEEIGQFAPYSGASNEMCHVFLARDLEFVAPAPEGTEEMDVLQLPEARIEEKVVLGEIWDGMSIAAYHLFRVWRNTTNG